MKKLSLAVLIILFLALYNVLYNKVLITPSQQQSLASTQSQTIPAGGSSDPLLQNNQQTTVNTPVTGIYKDGTYTGDVADAFYGNIQVKVTISDGKISDVQFLQYPNDRRNSIEINTYAMPILRQEAISAQSAQVDIVSGATDTSRAFIESLGTALSQARS
jgi:uncharacterized protein with FMN-binding domain